MKFLLLPISLVFLGLAPATHADDILDSLVGDGPVTKSEDAANPLRVEFMKEMGASSPEATIFTQFFFAGDYEKALYQFYSAFDGNARSSASGEALYSLLLFYNKLPVVGLERLFKIAQTSEIKPVILKLWRNAAPADHLGWQTAMVEFNPFWRDWFGSAAELISQSFRSFSARDLEYLTTLIAQAAPGSPVSQRLQWQRAQILASQDEVAEAARVLKGLLSQKKPVIDASEINLLVGRLLYQVGYLDQAIQYYERVQKKNPAWFDAQDEMAWAYLRKGNQSETIAITQTLMSPLLKGQVRAESYFIHQLVNLKVCDYPEVLKGLENFKSDFRTKAGELEKIAAGQSKQKKVEQLARDMEKGALSRAETTKKYAEFPIGVGEDTKLLRWARLAKQLRSEIKLAEGLYNRSLTGGTAQVGFVGELASLKDGVSARYQAATSSAVNRVKFLAQRELDEIKRVLDRSQIVEAELIQQLQATQKILAATKNSKDASSAPASKEAKSLTKSSETMEFPFQGENWFDELSYFKASVKRGCVAKREGVKE